MATDYSAKHVDAGIVDHRCGSDGNVAVGRDDANAIALDAGR